VTDDRLTRQLAFLVEADKLKRINRRTPLIDGSRLENSAEHSWHLVLAALVLREHVREPFDLVRVLELAAVHDLVEIDAGDTFAYDTSAQLDKSAREQAAAERIFGLLPADQSSYFRELWVEFEAQQSIEARFANSLDRFQALLLNANAGGGSWRTHEVTRAAVLRRMAPIESTLPSVWAVVTEIIETFSASGVLRDHKSQS